MTIVWFIVGLMVLPNGQEDLAVWPEVFHTEAACRAKVDASFEKVPLLAGMGCVAFKVPSEKK